MTPPAKFWRVPCRAGYQTWREANEHVENRAESILDDGIVTRNGIFDVVKIHAACAVDRLELDEVFWFCSSARKAGKERKICLKHGSKFRR